MKKIIAFLILISNIQSYACDICGCANGSSFVGLLPRSGNQFIGLRYRFRSFDSHLNSQMLKTYESFQTSEIWGRFYPIKKIQILAYVPYNDNRQTMLYSGSELRKHGLGDITVLAQYNILNTFFDTTNTSGIYQSILIGGGLKLATGKFKYGYSDEEVNPNFQLGTGSNDFLLNMIHTIKRKSFGLNTELGAKLTSKSNVHYQFGNRLSASTTAFYTYNFGDITIMPNIGINYDFGFKDIKEGTRNLQTGGYSLMSGFGSQLYYKKIGTGISFQKPLAQNLGGGELKVNIQTTVFLTYNL